MNENDCPYQILGVTSDASEAEIKKAYRKLALKNHPDKQTTDADREKAQTVFAKIANAYEILSDPEEREQYDLRKKYGGAPGTRYTTTKSPGGGGCGQPTYSESPQYSSSPQYTTSGSSTPQTSRRTSSYTTPAPAGGPVGTSYSQKDGKFTATVTKEDGTTYTFMGSSNAFQDPFEVFRKAFQDKTGEELPDNMKPQGRTRSGTNSPTSRKISPVKTSSLPKAAPVRVGTQTSTTINGNMKTITKTETLPDGRTRTSVEHVPINTNTSGSGKPTMMKKSTPTMQRAPMAPPKTTVPGTRSSTTINGDMKTITKTETLPNGRTRTSVEHVPINEQPTNTTWSVPQQSRVVTPSPHHAVDFTPTRSQADSPPSQKSRMKMPRSKNSPTAVKSHPTVQSGMGTPQPVGRSTKTRQVQHANGSIETITETTETMSDGTTRKSSSSTFSATAC